MRKIFREHWRAELERLRPSRRTGRREARPVDLIRRSIVQSFMRPTRVVVVNVAADRRAQLFRAAIFVDVNQLRLEAAEPALDHDVVCPAGFAVHALADAQALEQPFVFFTGKLTALVRI